MINAVTTFSPKGYEVYGQRMIESFNDYWPSDVTLYAFYEGDKPPGDAGKRVIWVSLDADEDRAAFMVKYAHREGSFEDYRRRAIRYSHKVWAQTRAPRDGHLLWIDADTLTVNPVTKDALRKLLAPEGKIAAYLARPYYRHSETGFIAYGPEAGPFLDEMRRMYVSGEVFELSEWHDCMVFDRVRVNFERQGKRFHNLCPNGIGLGMFEQSPLATIVRHNKGPERKERVYGDPMLTG